MFILRNKLNGALHGPRTRGEECSSTRLTGTLEDDPVPVQGLHPDGWPDQGLVGIHHVPPPGPWWEGRGELQTVCERALRLSSLLVQFCICQTKVVSININLFHWSKFYFNSHRIVPLLLQYMWKDAGNSVRECQL